MNQIKIFEYHGNNENEVNLWLKENPRIKVINVNVVPMHDMYSSTREISNQWIATIVIFEEATE